MEQWEFKSEHGGGWVWRRVGGAADCTSDRKFDSRTDCIADAMRHGYLESAPVESPQRRRNRHKGWLGVVSAYVSHGAAKQ